jgi:hypothetical protein
MPNIALIPQIALSNGIGPSLRRSLAVAVWSWRRAGLVVDQDGTPGHRAEATLRVVCCKRKHSFYRKYPKITKDFVNLPEISLFTPPFGE